MPNEKTIHVNNELFFHEDLFTQYGDGNLGYGKGDGGSIGCENGTGDGENYGSNHGNGFLQNNLSGRGYDHFNGGGNSYVYF